MQSLAAAAAASAASWRINLTVLPFSATTTTATTTLGTHSQIAQHQRVCVCVCVYISAHIHIQNGGCHRNLKYFSIRTERKNVNKFRFCCVRVASVCSAYRLPAELSHNFQLYLLYKMRWNTEQNINFSIFFTRPPVWIHGL